MEDYLMSVSDAVKRLKTDKATVYELIKRGLLKALKIRSLKISNSEINRFLTVYQGMDLSDLDNIKEIDLKEA
ncbi:helix-turn-helix domain-containing protein [Clostridium kluyveri]|uniref:helix-turn-helix domain-containing protein n=1 Tax=Clostridium kluyveri TaxID=1534 RepID=UPI002247F261|nr:helix-turn-helix domain-containing protein [Clostridium kluyveri]UZQ51623.1 helix-turn-helix domain-containing protein [Clostridium kluyveri]